jgi:proteic killer suppression protein
MQVRHLDRKLERVERDLAYTGGLGPNVAKAYRKVMGYIRAASDERAFYMLKALHYEKLEGKRSHQRSMRLNDQFRLVMEIEEYNGRMVVVVSVEDYH